MICDQIPSIFSLFSAGVPLDTVQFLDGNCEQSGITHSNRLHAIYKNTDKQGRIYGKCELCELIELIMNCSIMALKEFAGDDGGGSV